MKLRVVNVITYTDKITLVHPRSANDGQTSSLSKVQAHTCICTWTVDVHVHTCTCMTTIIPQHKQHVVLERVTDEGLELRVVAALERLVRALDLSDGAQQRLFDRHRLAAHHLQTERLRQLALRRLVVLFAVLYATKRQ